MALLVVGFKERMHTLRMSLFTQHTKAGLGRSLIEETRIFAKKNRCETLSLEVRMVMLKPNVYIEKLALSQDGEKGYYDENNEDALEMIIDLKEE